MNPVNLLNLEPVEPSEPPEPLNPVNLPKSSRYHRAKRRAEGLACLLTLGLLAALVLTPASVTLRTLVGGSAAAYAGVLLVAARPAAASPVGVSRMAARAAVSAQ